MPTESPPESPANQEAKFWAAFELLHNADTPEALARIAGAIKADKGITDEIRQRLRPAYHAAAARLKG